MTVEIRTGGMVGSGRYATFEELPALLQEMHDGKWQEVNISDDRNGSGYYAVNMTAYDSVSVPEAGAITGEIV